MTIPRGTGAILLTISVAMILGATPGTREPDEIDDTLIGVTIADVLRDEELQAFRVAVQATPLAQLLSSRGAYTLFAPTNRAFSLIAQDQLEQLIDDDGEMLSHHIVQGTLTIDVLRAMLLERGGQMSLLTLAGTELGFTLTDNGAIIIDGVAGIIAEGEIVANGVVLPIDKVLRYHRP